MTTKKHTTTLVSLAAGLCLFAGASAASAAIGDGISFDPNDRPGRIDPITDGAYPEFITPGLLIDPVRPPIGYIDIPEIDRGPEGDGDGDSGVAESNAPSGFGDFEGPGWLFSPFELDASSPVAASSGTVLDLLYATAPDLALSLDNKPAIGFSSIPAPGTGLLGVLTGLGALRRRR